MEGRPIDVGQVLHQLRLALGRLRLSLSPRQNLEIGPGALLGAKHPIDRGGDDVVDQRDLAAIRQGLRIRLGVLDVVVEILIDGLFDAVRVLSIELAGVEREHAMVECHHLLAVERSNGLALLAAVVGAGGILAAAIGRLAFGGVGGDR